MISGGGRPHGNTAKMVDAFVRGAEEAGNCIEKVYLLETKVEPCLGCNVCRHGKPCALKDGFEEIESIRETSDAFLGIQNGESQGG